jgi:protein-tyrosine phosphatase
MAEQRVRVLFVCLGNICRSPTAEGVMRGLVEEAGLGSRIEVESAGTGDWHVGEGPDERATAAAARRGITLGGSARRVAHADLESYDYVIAMDRDNLAELRRLASEPHHEEKLGLLREHDENATAAGELEVPDPYFGGADGFEIVLDAVEAACRGLLARIAEERI